MATAGPIVEEGVRTAAPVVKQALVSAGKEGAKYAREYLKGAVASIGDDAPAVAAGPA